MAETVVGSRAMDTFPSSPPAAVRAELTARRAAIHDSGIPPKNPDRNLRDALCLAEVVSRSDAVAPNEIKRELWELRRLKHSVVRTCRGRPLTSYATGEVPGAHRNRIRPASRAAIGCHARVGRASRARNRASGGTTLLCSEEVIQLAWWKGGWRANIAWLA